MMKKGCHIFWTSLILIGTLFVAKEAGAVLGAYISSIEADKKVLAAVRSAVTEHHGYSVHEIVSAGNTVREYTSPSGIIFAVAWNGLVTPDLDQLLGSYAGEYRRAAKRTARQRGRPFLLVKTSNIVVELYGHMRDLRGRAYVPRLVPSSVRTNDIK